MTSPTLDAMFGAHHEWVPFCSTFAFDGCVNLDPGSYRYVTPDGKECAYLNSNCVSSWTVPPTTAGLTHWPYYEKGTDTAAFYDARRDEEQRAKLVARRTREAKTNDDT